MNLSEFPEVRQNILLSHYTSMRVGGPARFFATVTSIESLQNIILAAKTEKIPFVILGGGCNTIASDDGYNGLVIKIHLNSVERQDCALRAPCGGTHFKIGAGYPTAAFAQMLAKESLTGFEWAAGIPGSIGGAIYGNAGAMGSETKDAIESVTIFDATNNQIKAIANDACEFSYRHSGFKNHTDQIICEAVFAFKPGNESEIRALIKQYLDKRTAEQPLDTSNSGCIFKNTILQSDEEMDHIMAKGFPVTQAMRDKKAISSWMIVDACGGRGLKQGGFEISTKHCNFFLNHGTGTARELKELITIIKTKALEKFGIELKEEVQYLG